jgi:hypothetical protein
MRGDDDRPVPATSVATGIDKAGMAAAAAAPVGAVIGAKSRDKERGKSDSGEALMWVVAGLPVTVAGDARGLPDRATSMVGGGINMGVGGASETATAALRLRADVDVPCAAETCWLA